MRWRTPPRISRPDGAFDRAARLAGLGDAVALGSTASTLAQSRRGTIGGGSSRADELPLAVTDSRGYSFAEATAGGVDLGEIDPSTMESRGCPGLYLVGEILDVDGRIGGFNFQWAWSSARVAATLAGRER